LFKNFVTQADRFHTPLEKENRKIIKVNFAKTKETTKNNHAIRK